MTCAFNPCEEPVESKGYCRTHAEQVRDGRTLRVATVRSPGEWNSWYMNNHGYIVRQRHIDGRRQHQLQHRFVMEQALGRPLVGDENVHHINGDRADNRLENLELWSTSQPKGQRVEDKIAWAREFLSRYDPAT